MRDVVAEEDILENDDELEDDITDEVDGSSGGTRTSTSESVQAETFA